jgi:hypothetical protein
MPSSLSRSCRASPCNIFPSENPDLAFECFHYRSILLALAPYSRLSDSALLLQHLLVLSRHSAQPLIYYGPLLSACLCPIISGVSSLQSLNVPSTPNPHLPFSSCQGLIIIIILRRIRAESSLHLCQFEFVSRYTPLAVIATRSRTILIPFQDCITRQLSVRFYRASHPSCTLVFPVFLLVFFVSVIK